MVVDHVAVGVKDPEETARRFEDEYGLRAVEGVRFESEPSVGNWLVPLGSNYVELMAIVDESADDSDFVRGFRSLIEHGDRWLGWAIHTSEPEARAQRLGVSIRHESLRFVSNGRRFTWDMLGFEERLLEPYLPFFLRWDEQEAFNQHIEQLTDETGNRQVADGIAGVEVSGDSQRLRDWLDGAEPPATVTAGAPAIQGVRLTNSDLVVRV